MTHDIFVNCCVQRIRGGANLPERQRCWRRTNARLDLHEGTRIFQHFTSEPSSLPRPPLFGATKPYKTVVGRSIESKWVLSGRSQVGRPRNVRWDGPSRDVRDAKDERFRRQNDGIIAKVLVGIRL